MITTRIRFLSSTGVHVIQRYSNEAKHCLALHLTCSVIMNTVGNVPKKIYTVQHNILMSHVSVRMNHHQAPLIIRI